MVDAGLSLTKPGPWPADTTEQEQRRIKARLIAESWALGGIDAMALGADDWHLGTELVRGLVADNGLPLLAANLVCDGSKPYPASKVLELKGHRIGVVGITAGEVEGCEVTEPAAAIREAVEAMGPVDVRLGLVPYDDDRLFVPLLQDGKLPLDIVVDARGRYPAAGPEKRGPTWAIGAGTRAKSLGVLQLTFSDPDAPWSAGGQEAQLTQRLETLRARKQAAADRVERAAEQHKELARRQVAAYDGQIAEVEEQLAGLSGPTGNVLKISQIELEKALPEHAETAKLIEAAKQQMTDAAGLDPRRFVPRVVTNGGPYAGGETCVPCHATQHIQWSKTAHARAWQSLVADNSALDTSCWGCHVTGAKLEGGPQSPLETSGFRDVQCEACHGPARDHLAEPEVHKPRLDPDPDVCTRCHDGVQDGGRFDFETYRPKVTH